MKTCHCRQIAPGIGDNALQPAFRWRRGGELAGWLIPSATLVLLPKCPVCVAVYVAFFSGLSITVASASNLRTSLQALCVAALLCLMMKRLCRLASRNKARSKPDEKTTTQQTDGGVVSKRDGVDLVKETEGAGSY